MSTHIDTPNAGMHGDLQPHALSTRESQNGNFERLYAHRQERIREERIGDGLGWLSVGLGLTALLAPRSICRTMGLPQRPNAVRAVGFRELVTGAALLTQPGRPSWLWARVAGDVMDLALLGSAGLRKDNPHRGRTAAALAVVASIGVADLAASLHQTRRLTSGAKSGMGGHEASVDHSMIVNKSPQECYEFWRDLSNLPRFIGGLEAITVNDGRVSRWVMKAPTGGRLEWNSEITADHPGQRISWKSNDDSGIQHAGTVRFDAAPGGRGTLVRVSMHLKPAMGRAAVGIATLMGRGPNFETRETLRRFKSLIETGEIPNTRGQSAGRRSWLGRLTPEGRKSPAEETRQGRAP